MPLRKELEAQTDIAKDQYKFFKNQENNVINKREEEKSVEDISDEVRVMRVRLLKSLMQY